MGSSMPDWNSSHFTGIEVVALDRLAVVKRIAHGIDVSMTENSIGGHSDKVG
jgi:hypothetical protein